MTCTRCRFYVQFKNGVTTWRGGEQIIAGAGFCTNEEVSKIVDPRYFRINSYIHPPTWRLIGDACWKCREQYFEEK